MAEPMRRVAAGLDAGRLALSEAAAPQVYRRLRHAIVTNRLQPGQPLSEKEIAAAFGLSRQPVREAFIKLAEAGLIRVLPQRGSFVVKISQRQVSEARFVREAVEVAVVRRACRDLTADAAERLQDVIAEQDEAARTVDQERFHALDDAFHRGLALGIGCAQAWQVVEGIKAQMDRVRFLSLRDASPMPHLIAQHRAILAAVARADPDAAEAAMRTHLGELLHTLPRLAAAFPDLFEAEGGAPVTVRADNATNPAS